jgi:hypothetical protein
MPSKRIQEVVERFVAELTQAAELDAAENIQLRLREALGPDAKSLVSVSAVAIGTGKRRKTTKGYSVLRPCPIPECKETAFPRHGMVCKTHKDLPREQILVARDNAHKEGGVWFGIKAGRKAG